MEQRMIDSNYLPQTIVYRLYVIRRSLFNRIHIVYRQTQSPPDHPTPSPVID